MSFASQRQCDDLQQKILALPKQIARIRLLLSPSSDPSNGKTAGAACRLVRSGLFCALISGQWNE